MNLQTLKMTQFGLLLALTLTVQLAGMPVFITGPLVNAVLIIVAVILGPVSGLLIGLLTPVIALIRGHLPPVLYMMIPFIALGNGIWVLVFYWIHQKTSGLNQHPLILWMIAVIPAAFMKFCLLTFSARILLPQLFGVNPPKPFLVLMTFPQLLTALAGGLLAFSIYMLYRRLNQI